MRQEDVPARTLLSDDEIRERMKSDPEVQRRTAEALEQAKHPSPGPGMTAEELQDLLREQA